VKNNLEIMANVRKAGLMKFKVKKLRFFFCPWLPARCGEVILYILEAIKTAGNRTEHDNLSQRPDHHAADQLVPCPPRPLLGPPESRNPGQDRVRKWRLSSVLFLHCWHHKESPRLLNFNCRILILQSSDWLIFCCASTHCNLFCLN